MVDETDDATLRRILEGTKTIAMVGASTNPVRPSMFVATYMSSRGRRVIPINPVQAGQTLLGEPVLASLADIPAGTQVDMVDIFRRSEAVPEVVDEALECLPGLKCIWMQFNVRHAEAAAKARAAGVLVVEDRCPKVEHMRLMGGTNLAGLGGGRISSKLPGQG
ncbi:MAG: CoA-binding protein [Silicimonas sp.]|nr:CoA-binding protein [Silicimonas sp.]